MFGPLYGQELVDRLDIHRQVLWRNLKVLLEKKIIIGKKVGKRKHYELRVTPEVADCIISILYDGGPLVFKRKIVKLLKLLIKSQNNLKENAQSANEYDDEFVELAASTNVVPYADNIVDAKTRRRNKIKYKKIGLSMEQFPANKKDLIKKKYSKPNRLITEIVKLSSENIYKIRKMTLFEQQKLYNDIFMNKKIFGQKVDSESLNWLKAFVLLSNFNLNYNQLHPET